VDTHLSSSHLSSLEKIGEKIGDIHPVWGEMKGMMGVQFFPIILTTENDGDILQNGTRFRIAKQRLSIIKKEERKNVQGTVWKGDDGILAAA
jgi:hypothetical protein